MNMSTPEPGGSTSHKHVLTGNGTSFRRRSSWFWAACLAGAQTIICHADPLPGFTIRGVDSQFAYGGPATYGWGIAVASTGPGVAITSLGIFDGAADGLLNPHQVVVLTYDSLASSFVVLRDVTIPAGTGSELVGGFRYVNITPLMLSPNQGIGLAAFYPGTDEDSYGMPNDIDVSREFIQPNYPSRFSAGASFTIPTQLLCPGQEGDPCLRFYPVNFRFEVVPEPCPVCLLGLGIGGLALVYRSRRKAGTRA